MVLVPSANPQGLLRILQTPCRQTAKVHEYAERLDDMDNEFMPKNSLKILKVPSKSPSMTAFVSNYSRDQVRYALYNPDKGTLCPFNRDLGVWRSTVFTT